MRRIVLSLCFLLLFIPLANAQWLGVVGSKPPAAAGCDPATNEVGDRNDTYTATVDIGNETLYCILYPPDCTGSLEYAHLYHVGTSPDNAKMCAYSDDGDSVPGTGDLLLGCSNAITSSSAGWAVSSNKVTGSVTNGTPTWVCVISDSTVWSIKRSITGSHTVYLKLVSGWYANPPATLSTGFTPTSNRDYSMYISIE